jgi:hypothetical protein
VPILNRLGLKPQRKRAGMVKIIPEAREELAEPVVWAILQSKIVLFPMIGLNALNTATEITAKCVLPFALPFARLKQKAV